jgi:hypothetical protein
VMDKFGGDSVDEMLDNLERFRRRASGPPLEPAGASDGAAMPETEVGSGGDD